jgi:FixJ family two-component response regulator
MNTRMVYLVDDDRMVRTALTRFLEGEGYEVQAFGSADDFLSSYHAEQPGCVVSDLAMPGMSGLELQRAAALAGIARPFVFISGQASVQSSVSAMRNGAVDFLTKPVCGDELLRAVQEAMQKDDTDRANSEVSGDVQRRLGALTPREREVLEHVVAGRLNKQIAADMGVVEKTVKVHRARVMEKMGVRSVAKLVHLWEHAGPAAAPAAPAAAESPSAMKRFAEAFDFGT